MVYGNGLQYKIYLWDLNGSPARKQAGALASLRWQLRSSPAAACLTGFRMAGCHGRTACTGATGIATRGMNPSAPRGSCGGQRRTRGMRRGKLEWMRRASPIGLSCRGQGVRVSVTPPCFSGCDGLHARRASLCLKNTLLSQRIGQVWDSPPFARSYGRTRKATLLDSVPPGVATWTVPVVAPVGTLVVTREGERTVKEIGRASC